MSAKIQLRRDSTWTSEALAAGEVGIEYDAGGIVKGIKIGRSDGGSTWANTDYVAGTMPLRSSTGITDFNGANSFGRYVWSNGTPLTTNAPFTIGADDGQVTVSNMVYDTTIVQVFSSEGNGTVPSKHYVRLYDGGATTWRSWQPTTNWATDATTGTPVTCTTLNAKGVATFDGVATFADGSTTNPSIANNGELGTGISFPSANTLALSTNSTAAITIGSAQGVTLSSNLVVSGNATITGATTLGLLAANLNANNNRLTSVANPTSAQDAVTKAYLEANRIGQTAYVTFAANGTPSTEQIGIAYTGTPTNFTNPSTGISAIRCPAGQTWRGLLISAGGSPLSVLLTNGACTQGDGSSSLGNPSSPFAFNLTRIT